jgi:hypothetical protein
MRELMINPIHIRHDFHAPHRVYILKIFCLTILSPGEYIPLKQKGDILCGYSIKALFTNQNTTLSDWIMVAFYCSLRDV